MSTRDYTVEIVSVDGGITNLVPPVETVEVTVPGATTLEVQVPGPTGPQGPQGEQGNTNVLILAQGASVPGGTPANTAVFRYR